MENRLNIAKGSLDAFKVAKHATTGKDRDLACAYLDWVKTKTDIITIEANLQVPSGVNISRGMVYWVDFGYNIDEEFGGKHPAIILRRGGNTAIVIPLSTQEPSPEQKASGIYVEVDRVYGFKSMTRWINVLNSMPVSIFRFDFSRFGNVKGHILDKIKIASQRSGLW